mmetsp:Transcript_8627/g.12733  ORF Transcript_8627/g.12733 Transcript_8627/m.12733 type:complete len:614 (+) Transcript_8627:53-1894(+)
MNEKELTTVVVLPKDTQHDDDEDDDEQSLKKNESVQEEPSGGSEPEESTNDKKEKKKSKIYQVKAKINACTKAIDAALLKVYQKTIVALVSTIENRIFKKTDWLSKKKFLCWKLVSPREVVTAIAVFCLVLLILGIYWVLFWILFGPYYMFPWQGVIFSLGLLVTTAYMGGWIGNTFFKFPPLLGMLIVGFIFRNAAPITLMSITDTWSSNLRSFALGIILIKAGLGLDLIALRRLGFNTMLLSTTPNLVECIVVALISYGLLYGLPWVWVFMLGFCVVAVSPAVVVPSIVSLQERGYGVEKGIPTMILAAASFDDVIAISGFGIFLGIAFQHGSMVMTILHGPIEIVSGVLGGILLGLIVWPLRLLPSKYASLRTLLIFGIGLTSLFGCGALGYSGAGALGAMIMATCTAYSWKPAQVKQVSDVASTIWLVAQPILFALIGAEIQISQLDGKTVGFGVLTLVIGLVFRIAACLCCTIGAGLNWKEKIFVCICWMPKATVQAAVGPLALDTARRLTPPGSMERVWGQQILTIAVLAILLTAPLGSLLISIVGPLFLKQKGSAIHSNDLESSSSSSNHVVSVSSRDLLEDDEKNNLSREKKTVGLLNDDEEEHV